MPGIRVEKLTGSMVISRFMRRATSVKRSIWNPSTPPPSLGMACGAKVPSTPVRSGGSFSWASTGPVQRSVAIAVAGNETVLHDAPPREHVVWIRPGPARRPASMRACANRCGKVAPILSESTEQVKPGPRGSGVRTPRSRREALDEVLVGIYCGPVRATVGIVGELPGPHLVDGHGGRG